MKKILDIITDEMKKAFAANGYDENFAKVTLSNRPDLCEYQCNGAMAAAKTYKKKPIDIANGVVEQLKDSEVFEEVNAVMPGLEIRPGFPFRLHERNEGCKEARNGRGREAGDNRYRLRRSKRRKAAPRRTSPFRGDR
mgnify:CR=1 FL=1